MVHRYFLLLVQVGYLFAYFLLQSVLPFSNSNFCTHLIAGVCQHSIKMSSSELQGQEEATYMLVFRLRPSQLVIHMDGSSKILECNISAAIIAIA